MEHESQFDKITENPSEEMRAEALMHARNAVRLAEELKLVSLNVAIESAKTPGDTFDVRVVKRRLSELTSQAIKASKQMTALINAISGTPQSDSSGDIEGTIEFRTAVELRRNLDTILEECERAGRALDRVAPVETQNESERFTDERAEL